MSRKPQFHSMRSRGRMCSDDCCPNRRGSSLSLRRDRNCFLVLPEEVGMLNPSAHPSVLDVCEDSVSSAPKESTANIYDHCHLCNGREYERQEANRVLLSMPDLLRMKAKLAWTAI